jgi:hypothetical protein
MNGLGPATSEPSRGQDSRVARPVVTGFYLWSSLKCDLAGAASPRLLRSWSPQPALDPVPDPDPGHAACDRELSTRYPLEVADSCSTRSIVSRRRFTPAVAALPTWLAVPSLLRQGRRARLCRSPGQGADAPCWAEFWLFIRARQGNSFGHCAANCAVVVSANGRSGQVRTERDQEVFGREPQNLA